jgi:hypothetical protein
MSLYLEGGAECGSELLGCNAPPGGGAEARVTRWLAAGEPVTVRVASTGGADFHLAITSLATTCPATTVAQFTSLNGLSGVLDDTGAEVTGISCEPTPNGFHDEDTYGFTLKLTGTLMTQCFLTITGDYDLQTILLRGNQCDGAEVAGTCQSGRGANSYTVTYSFTTAWDGDYTLIVQGPWETIFPLVTNYTLSASCVG